MNERVIRAVYDNETIIVYQAFNKNIAKSAAENQTFISPPFKMERMTWIKPSFLWMMYRSGWAQKEDGKQILRIKITRQGFEDALRMSCLSTFNKDLHISKEDWKIQLVKSPVRTQWDPERDLFLNSLNYRTIQVGLSGIAVTNYINKWIISIENITDYVNEIYLLSKINSENAKTILPKEEIYPVPIDIKQIIGSKE